MEWQGFPYELRTKWEQFQKNNLNKSINRQMNEFISENYVANKWPSATEEELFNEKIDLINYFRDDDFFLFKSIPLDKNLNEQFLNLSLLSVESFLVDVTKERNIDNDFEEELLISLKNKNKVHLRVELFANRNFDISSEEIERIVKKKIREIEKNKYLQQVNLEINVYNGEGLANLINKYSYQEGVKGTSILKIKKSDDSSKNYLKEANLENIPIYITILNGASLKGIYIDLKKVNRVYDLFSLNVREYVSLKRVDSQIRDTIEKDPNRFFIYNNGLTIVGKNIDFNIDGKTLKIDDMCILNGAQTVSIIGETDDQEDLSKVFVLAKVIDISNFNRMDDVEEFVAGISLASNNQKPIKNQDLISQIPLVRKYQIKFDKASEKFGSLLQFQIKRSDEIKNQIKKINKQKPIDIDGFIKLYLWALLSKPGTSRSSINSYLSLDSPKFKKISRIFEYLDPEKKAEKFFFIEDTWLIKDVINKFVGKKLKSVELESINDNLKREKKEFLNNGRLFISTIFIDVRKTFNDKNYLENLKKRSNVENYWIEEQGKLTAVFDRTDSIQQTKLIKEKLLKFLDEEFESIYNAFFAIKPNTKTTANATKEDSIYYEFAKKYINEEVNGKEYIKKRFIDLFKLVE